LSIRTLTLTVRLKPFDFKLQIQIYIKMTLRTWPVHVDNMSSFSLWH